MPLSSEVFSVEKESVGAILAEMKVHTTQMSQLYEIGYWGLGVLSFMLGAIFILMYWKGHKR